MSTSTSSISNPGDAVDAARNWWNSDLAQLWLVERPISVAVVVIVAIVAHWVLRHLINKLAKQAIKNGGGTRRLSLPQVGPLTPTAAKAQERTKQQNEALLKAKENRRIARIRTLAGVGRSAVAIFVWVWASITILSQIGVDVTPIIASAGVIGVALGFGAQSLVKDFLSGIFMLVEDQYGIGDWIDLGGGANGEVEDITMRVTTLRDVDGALWYVRNGEILRVANHSDQYSIARIEIPLAPTADLSEAAAVIEKSAQAAATDVENLILDEPNMVGVISASPTHVDYRVTIKTLPGVQWDVQHAVLARIWSDLQDAGIETPHSALVADADSDE